MNDEYASRPDPSAESHAAPAAIVERRPMSRRAKIISWIVAAVVLALVLIWIFGLAGDSSAGGPGGRRFGGRSATTVGTEAAKAMDVPVTLDALGTVTPKATVTVRPQVSGTIQQILFREGEFVNKGQTLAIIDPRPFQAALTQAQGALSRDQAQLQNARLTLSRYRTLLSQDSIARQDVDTQAALVQQLEGTIESDQGAVANAKLDLGFTKVTAPIDGRIGLRVTDIGNYIGAGDANGLAVITTLSPIDVQFTVPQDDVPMLRARERSGDTLPAIAFDRTRTNELDRGTFLTLDNQVNVNTGTVSAKARFPNSQGNLYPSQFVNVRLQVNMIPNAVTVPATAVRQGTSGSYVWLLGKDQTVSQRPVTLGQTTEDRVVITDGLAVGDVVVTEGGDRLTDGGKVQTAETAAKAAKSGGTGEGRRGRQGRRGGGRRGQGD